MINRQALLADLQKFLQRIEADLLERSESTEVPEVPAALHAEYEKAAKAERTAQNYEDWRTDTITQAAAAWVLSCVFGRFLEDNSLIDPPKIAGPADRLARARDEHELYFRSHPQHTDREYLLSIFDELAKLPGTRDIFGEHNAINDLPNWLSGDAAGDLLNFFQKIDASTGDLVHNFTDPNWDTRFLGDLYQDLSEAARKKFALLQTPDFVEEFILDRTLNPAIEEFGLVPQPSGKEETSATRFKMIDPACGSGHFLLGAFPRLLDCWQRKEPGTNIRELTQRVLDSIHGVDINPFAVAIAKFRLLLVSIKTCGVNRLDQGVPGFRINVACGDSLLHGENRTSTGQNLMDFADGATDHELYSHAYPGEDLETVRSILKQNSYHCVVANPPYIVPKDRKLNDWYRKRFSACHMKYSLSVPFMQQIFALAVNGGYTGQITSNSFMKREFGKKLIETFFPTVDLTHVIDTSGAFIPGHATPTTILFGKSKAQIRSSVRVVMGIRGEPTTPLTPRDGRVWKSITEQIDLAVSKSDFVSTVDAPISTYHKHPWSIGGGGASELKEEIDSKQHSTVDALSSSIGFLSFPGLDDAFVLPASSLRRRKIPAVFIRDFVCGERVRDWLMMPDSSALAPYDSEFKLVPYQELGFAIPHLWTVRTSLQTVVSFGGKTRKELGEDWWGWYRWVSHKYKSPYSLVFAQIASHIHFCLDEGGRTFNVTAPAIKLRSGELGDHYSMLAFLNSSTVCFWLKQVSHRKQMMGGESVRIDSPCKVPHQYSGTQVGQVPIPASFFEGELRERLQHLGKCAHQIGRSLSESIAQNTLVLASQGHSNSLRESIQALLHRRQILRSQLLLIQEEIDFTVYAMFEFVDTTVLSIDALPEDLDLDAGQRPFEMLSGANEDGFPVIRDPRDQWPEFISKTWKQRMVAIEEINSLSVLEQPEYKRRWIGWQGKYNRKRQDDELRSFCEELLVSRLEAYFDFDGRLTDAGAASKRPVPLGDVAMYSVAYLADAARRDPQFMEVGELYRDDPAFDVQSLVEELVAAESVPHLPILRYKDSGLRKRAEWEKTWDFQRREDAGESVSTIPVPPKYTSTDFISTGGARYWSLRGKLDVPKERWISFPHCEGPDGTLVICWAGYDHLQQAQAISAYYVRVQTEFGGSDDPRLIPLLASLIELLPWLKQWHNEPNANFDGLRMGDYFEGFVNEEARNLGKTLQEIKAWVPPKKVAKTAAPKSSTKKTSKRKESEDISQTETSD
jgi:hypothetical protein